MQDKRRQGLGIVGIKIEKADMERINGDRGSVEKKR